jgi:predicted phage terminase large subunit-like protein
VVAVRATPARTPRQEAALADLDLVRADRARRHLIPFTQRMYSRYEAAAFHREVAAFIEEVLRGGIRYGIIIMPPRHGKSTLASEHTPPYALGRQPDEFRIIHCSHTQKLADQFSRRARNKFRDPRWPFPDVKLSMDVANVREWDIARAGPDAAFGEPYRGGYVAAGVGGPITGMGANLLLIDDPVKSAADAYSPNKREALWEWFTGTALTRLESNSRVLMIGCLTADTNVLLATGREKPICDIRPGDRVATYEDGTISVSRVTNWINHGPDCVFAIRMKSGIIVKANARHPFLVERDGQTAWRRTDTLEKGTVILRVTGANGGVSPAPSRGAANQRNARACATGITATIAGQAAFARLRSTLRTAVGRIFGAATASISRTTNASLPSRVACVPYASSRRPPRTAGRVAKACCTSIIATIARRCGACCATTATSWWATGSGRNSSWPPLSTCEITRDTVLDVTECGSEDVFDIEVERTENFIANGLVSHNTRWHHDDLIGRALRRGDRWEVLHKAAIDDAGNALWPERYPLEAPSTGDPEGDKRSLSEIREDVGEANFLAQFQGVPTPDEGAIWHWEWFDQYDRLPDGIRSFEQHWDTAFKTAAVNDYSVCTTWAVSPFGMWLVDLWRGKLEFPDLEDKALALRAEWKPNAVYIEDKASGQSLIQSLRKKARFSVIAVEPCGDKVRRAIDCTPVLRSRRVHIPRWAPWLETFKTEISGFPLAVNDDQVDSVSQAIARVYHLGEQSRGLSVGSYSATLALPGDDDERELPEGWRG